MCHARIAEIVASSDSEAFDILNESDESGSLQLRRAQESYTSIADGIIYNLPLDRVEENEPTPNQANEESKFSADQVTRL